MIEDQVETTTRGSVSRPPAMGLFGSAIAHRAAGLGSIADRSRRNPELRRVATFLVAGGLSALVTLTVTGALTYRAHLAFFVASLVGIELGILVNFSINDARTFSDLLGHRRPLPMRLVRFHLTCALGQSLILLSSLVLYDLAHWRTVFAQAVPIAVVTAVNFTMHRFWTYRASHRAAELVASPASAAAPVALAAPPETPRVVPVLSPRRRTWRWLVCWVGALACLTALGWYHLAVYVPQPDRPHRFTVLDRLFNIGVAAVMLYGALLVGLYALRRAGLLSRLGRLEVAALATGLGLGVLSLAVLALGLVHLYYPVTFVALFALLPVPFTGERAWVGERVREAGRALQDRLRTWSLRTIPATQVMAAISRLALIAVSASVFVVMFACDLTMPSTAMGYDTYQYHWAVPLLLLRAHGWLAFPGWAHANLPFGTEMLNLAALSLQANEAALLVQDAFVLLTSILVYALIRRTSGELAAWLAVVALLTIPLVMAYTTESFVETALVFYGIAALCVLVGWLEAVGQGRLEYAPPALAGVLGGFAADAKYTAVQILGAEALLVAVGLAVLAWRNRHTNGIRHPMLEQARRMMLAVGIYAGGILLALGPWLLKDWIFLGDPVYPALGTIFPTPVWNAARTQMLAATFAHFGPHSGLVSRYHLYPLDLALHARGYDEGIPFPTGLGQFAVVLAIPYLAVVVCLRLLRRGTEESRRALVIVVLACCALVGAVVWSFSGALVERYAIPWVVLATLLGAVMLGRLLALVPQRLSLLSLVLVIGLALVAAQQEYVYLVQMNLGWRNPAPLLSASTSEQRFMRIQLSAGVSDDFWQAADYVNTQLPHDGKLLMLGRGTGYFFTNRDYVADSGGDWIPYLVSQGRSPDGMLHILHEQGYTYVVYDAGLIEWLTDKYQNGVLASYLPTYLTFQQQRLVLIHQWGIVSLYRVPKG